MEKTRLGRTGICVHKNGFGALPIQRISEAEACSLLQRAFEGGINFYDTARAYSDSERKLGLALADRRDDIVLASKTASTTPEEFWADLNASLFHLKIHKIDIYQFHNPAFCPMPGDGSGLYEAMLEARAQGKIRWIGLTNHRLHVARQAVESGLYDTLQFPFSYLAGKQELELLRMCEAANVGFIAMKALGGGMISDAATAYSFMLQHKNALPIWGIQRQGELDAFLEFQKNPPAMNAARQERIREDRAALGKEFCRSCGYCMPCPKGIEISNCARMALLLRRSPPAGWLTEEWQKKMEKTKECMHCNLCVSRCPYELSIPTLLEKNYADYQTFL